MSPRRPRPITPRPRPGSVIPPPAPQTFTYHGIHRKTGKRYSIKVTRVGTPPPAGCLTEVLLDLLSETDDSN